MKWFPVKNTLSFSMTLSRPQPVEFIETRVLLINLRQRRRKIVFYKRNVPLTPYPV
jgi:hypothetical protein